MGAVIVRFSAVQLKETKFPTISEAVTNKFLGGRNFKEHSGMLFAICLQRRLDLQMYKFI